MGVTTSPTQMGSAQSAAAAMSLSSVPPDPASTSSPSGLERRAGSSRIRRPPKRLLSPPADRPQQQSASHPSSHERGMLPTKKADDVPLLPSETNPLATSVTPKPTRPRSKSNRQPPKQPVDEHLLESPGSPPAPSATSSSAHEIVEIASEPVEGADTGPGKRKRKPSTMTKPPSTITHPTPSPTATLPGRTSTLKSAKARHSTGSCLKKPHLPSLDENSTYSGDYESDGGKGAADLDTDVEGMGDVDEHEQRPDGFGPDHLAAPPLIFQRNGACLLKTKLASRVDSKLSQQTKKRDFSSQSSKGKRRISTSPSHESRGRAVASPPTPQYKVFAGTHFVHHLRTQSMPSISQITPWGCRSLQRASAGDKATVQNLSHSALDVESDSDGDEDDFHRTMLDSDFEELDSWTRLSDFDTPATTPRSPQSSCGQLDTSETASASEATISFGASVSKSARTQPGVKAPSPSATKDARADDQTKAEPLAECQGRPRGEVAPDVALLGAPTAVTSSPEGKQSTDCNTVFAHALPPSDRPKDQDGLRLLSLPFGDLKGFASPHMLKQGSASSRFTTPTLERMASRENLHEVGPISSSPSDGKGRKDDVDSMRAVGEGASGVTSTSPTLSPTQTVFSLIPVRGANESEQDEHSGSAIASPFLAAIRHRRSHEGELSASASRAVSPIPFRLSSAANAPQLRVEQASSEVLNGADAHSEPRAEQASSVTISYGKAPETSVARQSSQGVDDERTLNGNGGQSNELHDEPSDEDSTFSLPETMALDEIDAAYGGSSQPPGKLASVQKPAAVAVGARGCDVDADSDVREATSPGEHGTLEFSRSLSCTPSSKRSLLESSLERAPAVDSSAEGTEAQDAPEDDSPRPRKVTRARAASGASAKEPSHEDKTKVAATSPGRRTPSLRSRRSAKASMSGMSSDDEREVQEATDGQGSPSKAPEVSRPARTRSSRVIRRPVK